MNLFVLAPGEPMSMYHWEADQEGFLFLSRRGACSSSRHEEQPLRAWDYFHCPPNVSHTIVGAGSGPAAIPALGAREHADGDRGGYPYSEVAMSTTRAPGGRPRVDVAYARFPPGSRGEFRRTGCA